MRLIVVSRLLGNVMVHLGLANSRLSVLKYRLSGRKPWTMGYSRYREMVIRDVLRDRELLDCFLHNGVLPAHYGYRLDERVVEYPWIFARLGVAGRLLLDAGSTLNFGYILDLPQLTCRSVVIYNLSPEGVVRRGNVSYIYGDLRHTILKDECFDEIVCISTLEHVGMDNTFLYSRDVRFNESKRDEYRDAIREFRRLLKPGGKLFITVPYGRYENLGWLQQFDKKMVEAVLAVFGGSASTVTYYQYFADGWQVAEANVCAESSYFDIHHRSVYEPDYVAAARAVACIEMEK